ncbi:iron-sulfur cluster assembly accessory protein [Cohnella fermenti]|uniref:Iron-sulfur cluster assembly accessory protein n=1 Tax=Cohnella fermenti TaxID=2565925 RepID=A0A4S4BXH7_9BACL|nr:iron-sulfur cluster assembly accessory protein [Cohnella fermenti]THF79918.1 iron-sulfur cluster assembly accessory protein [Cohnella fermenti]
MKCKITRNAAKVLLKEIEKPENEGLKLRVFVTHAHGDHAHYGMDLGKEQEGHIVVSTDKGIDVLLKEGDDFLDGIIIDYLYLPQEGFVITNPSKGNHGEH